jgi:ATP-dependent Clp protease ATP-binding subunit ClpB
MHPTGEQFTEKTRGAVVAAQQLAQQKRQQHMESEQLFAALLGRKGLAGRILVKAGVNLAILSQKLDALIASQPSLSSPRRQCLPWKGAQRCL